MHAESQPFTPIASKPARRPTITAHEHASPAAFDEIFANLAHRQDRVERENELRFDATQIRDNAEQMQRQRDRLAQLLRDIDCSA